MLNMQQYKTGKNKLELSLCQSELNWVSFKIILCTSETILMAVLCQHKKFSIVCESLVNLSGFIDSLKSNFFKLLWWMVYIVGSYPLSCHSEPLLFWVGLWQCRPWQWAVMNNLILSSCHLNVHPGFKFIILLNN